MSLINLRISIRKLLSESFTDSEPYENKNRKEPKNHTYKVIGFDSKNIFAVLMGLDNKIYAFYYADFNKEPLKPYAHLLDMEEQPVIDSKTIEYYVNDNIETLQKGDGLQAWDNDEGDLIKIDQELKDKLLVLFSKSDSIVKALNSVDVTKQ